MITVEQLYKTVEEIRKIYPFKNEDAMMSLRENISLSGNLVEIQTIDKATGIEICMRKDVRPKEISMEDIKCQRI